MEMPAAARMRVCTSVSVPVLFARWLDFPPFAECVTAFLPWEPVLSIKLLRLNREVLDAKY